MHIAVQADGGLLAGGNGVDGKLRAGVAVAADEDVRLRGLIGQRVRLGGALFRRRERAGIERAPVDRLADGADDGIDGDRLELAGADGLAAALLVRLAERHALDPDAGDLAVLAEDLDRRGQEAELHALFHRLFDLFGVGGELGLTAAVEHVRLVRAEAHRAAADVHGHVAAADDGTALAEGRVMAEVHGAQEVHAAVDALELLARDAELGRLLCADGEVEALVALCAQLLDGDVLADLDAAAEFDAHLAQDVNLGVEHVFFEAEARDAEREHAAGHRVAVEHGHGVALVGEVVGAAHARGAGADDGDLLRVRAADLVEQLRHVARGLVQVVVGDEALDLVDGDGLVHVAAGALGLAELVADAAADSRERVFFLDELERVRVAALRGELQVALHGDVRGAGGLARGGAGGHDILVVLAVVRVPAALRAQGLGELDVVRLLCQVLGRAELLAELERIAGAGLHALAAGDALGLVHLSDVVGADRVARAIHQTHAQAEAGTGAAVADGRALARLFNVDHVVHEAVFFGALDDLERLLARDLLGAAGADVVLGALAHLDAHVLIEVAAAVADARARCAAGARRHREAVVLVQIVRNALKFVHTGNALERALDRDDAHEAVAVGDHGAHVCREVAGVFLERAADLRMRFQQLLLVDHHLEDAGCEDLHVIRVLAERLVVRAAEDAVVYEVVEQGLHLLHGLADLPGQVGRSALLAQAGRDGDIRFLVGQDACHAVVFGCVFVDLGRDAGDAPNDLRQLHDLRSELCHGLSSFMLLR